MGYKVKIKLADDTVKEFTIGSDVELPTGLNLTGQQIALLLGQIESISALMKEENWKTVEVEKE